MSDNISKWDSIVSNPAADLTKTEPIESEVAKSTDLGDKEGAGESSKWDKITPAYVDPGIIEDKEVDIDLEDYRGILGNEIYMPQAGGVEALDKMRADGQSGFQQFANMLGQAALGEGVAGTIEGFGYMLDIGSIIDLMQGDEVDFGNFLTDIGSNMRESVTEAMPIYQDPTAHGWGKMLDSGWWAQNSVSVASSLSMLLPTGAAMKGLSYLAKVAKTVPKISKGMKAARNMVGLAEEASKREKWMTNGISQAILSRNIENWMEAHGTFEDMKTQKMQEIDNKTGEAYTEDEAIRIASEAASSNYKKGWAMVLQDIPQYLALGKVFDPRSKKMTGSFSFMKKAGIKTNLKPWQEKAVGLSSTFFGEASEEAIQYMISEQSKLKANLDSGYITQEEYDEGISEAIGSEEMWTSAFFGGLGGLFMKGASSGLEKALKSKSDKDYEKTLSEVYTNHVENKAKQVQLSFQHLNKADQDTNKQYRDRVISESITNLAVESLENDKFDQFYETLGMVADMSEEDAANFAKETGTEFNRELAKQDAPRLQEMALEIKDEYLKHLNNNDSQTASRLARLSVENSRLEKASKERRKETSETRDKMKSQLKFEINPLTEKKIKLQEKKEVLTDRRKYLKKRLEETSEYLKPFVQASLDTNERLLKKNELDFAEYKKQLNDRSPEQKKHDNSDLGKSETKATKDLYELYKDDIIDGIHSDYRANEQILINNEDMAFYKSKEGAKLRRDRNIQKKISEITGNKDKKEALKDLEKIRENDIPKSEISEKNKSEIAEAIDSEISSIKEEIKQERQLTTDEFNLLNETLENNKNNEDDGTPNNVNVNGDSRHEVDGVEDYNFDEDVDSDHQQIKSSNDHINDSSKGKGLVALLDKIVVAGKSIIEKYDNFVLNTENKEKEVFSYSADVNSKMKSASGVIAKFNDLKKKVKDGSFKEGDEIPKDVIDNLPIKVSLDRNDSVFTFLPTKPLESDDDWKKANYEREYAEERALIVKRMLFGGNLSSEVALATGGDLQMDYDHENMRQPEHSLLDIQQIGGDISNIELLVTDDEGRFINMFKEYDSDLKRAIYLKQRKNSSKLPYRGGAFLKVRKANGDAFALKLNNKKNTKEQATLLADILIRVGVTSPELDKDGKVKKGKKGKMVVSKELKLSTSLSSVEKELREKILQVMGPEVEMLDQEYKDPTINELIESFVYMSEKTRNKTSALFMEGNDIKFGSDSAAITMVNKDLPETRENFIEFLMEKKRRQFKISMWNNSENYKKFIIDQGILSTDASIDGPLFKNTAKKLKSGKMDGRRAQLYLKPLRPIKKEEPKKNSKGETILPNNSPKNTSEQAKQEELKEAKAQLDFEIDRLNEIDTSEEANTIDKQTLELKKNESRARYSQEVDKINKKYSKKKELKKEDKNNEKISAIEDKINKIDTDPLGNENFEKDQELKRKLESELNQLKRSDVNNVENVVIPEYKVDRTLSNGGKSKRYASTNGSEITINPVEGADGAKKFFEYFTGKEGGVTSRQKKKVLIELAKKGWSLKRISELLNTNKKINTFLVLHEQNHIDNNDRAVYWAHEDAQVAKKGGTRDDHRNMMTRDKINMEVRATIIPLLQIESMGDKLNVKSNKDIQYKIISESSKIQASRNREIVKVLGDKLRLDKDANLVVIESDGAKSDTDIAGAFTGGIFGQNKQIYEALVNGESRIAGLPSPEVANLKGFYESGFIKSVADVFARLNPKSAEINKKYDDRIKNKVLEIMSKNNSQKNQQTTKTEVANGDVSTLKLDNGKEMPVVFKNGKWHKQKKDGNPYKAPLPRDKQDKLNSKNSQPTQQASGVEIEYSPIDMSEYGESYTQADISKGGKSIIFNSIHSTAKIENGVVKMSINDIDGKTFYPISADLSNTPEYKDYEKKLNALNAKRKELQDAGERGIQDMLRGDTTATNMARKKLLDLVGNELKKNNNVTSVKGGKLSKPTQQAVDVESVLPNSDKKPSKKELIESTINTLSSNKKNIRKVESKDGLNRYYIDDAGNRYIGMSSIVNPSTFEGDSSPWTGAIPIGNAADKILREFFSGKETKYEGEVAKRLTKEAYDELIEGAKNLKKRFENKYGKGNIEFLTEGLFIGDTSVRASQKDVNKTIKSESERKLKYGLATELDMVFVNKKTGTVHLIDFKTKRTDKGQDAIYKLSQKWPIKKGSEIRESKADGYSRQQNASRLLLEKTTGIKFESMHLLVAATRYDAFGQQSSTAKIQDKMMNLDKQDLSDVFPENYVGAMSGEVSEIDDTITTSSNQNDLSLAQEEATKVKSDYIYEKETEEKSVDAGEIDMGAAFNQIDFAPENMPSKDLQQIDGDSSEIKTSCDK